MVDLPLADSPVNQTVKPRWPRKALRSAYVRDACHVMFLLGKKKFFKSSFGLSFSCGGGGLLVREKGEGRNRVRRGQAGEGDQGGIPTMLPFFPAKEGVFCAGER